MFKHINAYQSNFSNEEFVQTSFLLLKRKLVKIYELTQADQTIEVIKERYEKTSSVLEALTLINTLIDFSNEDAVKLSNYYNELQMLIFEGNYSNPSILLGLIKKLN